MELLIISFAAGILTVAAPCILPLLPVIVGGSIARNEPSDSGQTNWRRPVIVAASLAVSVVFFSLLLKATTALLGVSQMVWQLISGIIILLLGINLLWPSIWEKFALLSGFYNNSSRLLSGSYTRKGFSGDALTGFALGPVFNSCSPTYALIVAAVLPASFSRGLIYLLAYALGLAGALLVITFAGQGLAARLGWLSNPAGLFRRVTGVLFILVGLSVIAGLDKKAQSYILERGWYDPISRIERSLK